MPCRDEGHRGIALHLPPGDDQAADQVRKVVLLRGEPEAPPIPSPSQETLPGGPAVQEESPLPLPSGVPEEAPRSWCEVCPPSPRAARKLVPADPDPTLQTWAPIPLVVPMFLPDRDPSTVPPGSAGHAALQLHRLQGQVPLQAVRLVRRKGPLPLPARVPQARPGLRQLHVPGGRVELLLGVQRRREEPPAGTLLLPCGYAEAVGAVGEELSLQAMEAEPKAMPALQEIPQLGPLYLPPGNRQGERGARPDHLHVLLTAQSRPRVASMAASMPRATWETVGPSM